MCYKVLLIEGVFGIEPYNVKIITYPDLTKQVRIYQRPVISSGYHRKERYRNPFDNQYTREIDDDLDAHFNHVQEVSTKRTKKKVYDYAKSNDWDWFVTFTFSPDKVNRMDYDSCVKALKTFLDYLRRSSPTVSYLVVPEEHEKGGYHFHGLFSGILDKEVVWSGKYVIKRFKTASGRARFVRTSDKIYQIGKYKLGWMTATCVKDKERVTSYITKYITKEMLAGLYGRKRYWCSRNLLKPEEEVYTLDQVDRMILSTELDCVSSYSKVSQMSYGDLTQVVKIYEV